MAWRTRLTRVLLWGSVLGWGILLGGKLFDLLVLVGAWSASPPASLNLLPYGPRFPVDTGEYFFPSSVALLVCSIGVMISGWKTPASYRVWLILPAVMLFVTLIFTVTWFWPRNAALWAVAQGAPNAVQDPVEVVRMVHQWVSYDWLRVAVVTMGFVCSIRAISMPFPVRDARGDR
jgi:hypothetical protein